MNSSLAMLFCHDHLPSMVETIYPELLSPFVCSVVSQLAPLLGGSDQGLKGRSQFRRGQRIFVAQTAV